MGDESLTEPTKITTGIDTWFVIFLALGSVLLLVEAVFMLSLCNNFLMFAFYVILSWVAAELAKYYAKEES